LVARDMVRRNVQPAYAESFGVASAHLSRRKSPRRPKEERPTPNAPLPRWAVHAPPPKRFGAQEAEPPAARDELSSRAIDSESFREWRSIALTC
jgi:hypothetical protein